MHDQREFITRREAAAILRKSEKTLANWASKGVGPTLYNPTAGSKGTGGGCRYDRTEVNAYITGTIQLHLRPALTLPMPPKRGRPVGSKNKPKQ